MDSIPSREAGAEAKEDESGRGANAQGAKPEADAAKAAVDEEWDKKGEVWKRADKHASLPKNAYGANSPKKRPNTSTMWHSIKRLTPIFRHDGFTHVCVVQTDSANGLYCNERLTLTRSKSGDPGSAWHTQAAKNHITRSHPNLAEAKEKAEREAAKSTQMIGTMWGGGNALSSVGSSSSSSSRVTSPGAASSSLSGTRGGDSTPQVNYGVDRCMVDWMP